MRKATLARLREVIAEIFRGQSVIVFGSILKPGQFGKYSDIDLALPEEPAGGSYFGLLAELEERLGRNVDLVLLDRCRFRAKILREGVAWTN